MEEKPLKYKSYDVPSVSPHTLRAIALGHFLYASFTFVTLAVGNVVTPQAQNMKRTLQRTGDFKESLRQHLDRRLPSSRWIQPVNQTVSVGLAVLLLAAGSCLSQRRAIGRNLSLVFAGVCLAQQIGMMAWQLLAEVPMAREYLDQMTRLYPKDVDLIGGILTPIANGPTFHLLIAVYPVCVLAIMLQPGVKELLTPELPTVDLPAELPSSHRIVQMKEEPSSAGNDPLIALMQRKTF